MKKISEQIEEYFKRERACDKFSHGSILLTRIMQEELIRKIQIIEEKFEISNTLKKEIKVESKKASDWV